MKTLMLILAVIVGLALIAGGAILIAINRNGPAVLDTVDRISGGKNNTELLHKQSLGVDPRQKLLVYGERSPDEALPVFIFIHGGSWRSGNPDDYGFIARSIAPEGYIVVLGGYCLRENGRYPAMLQDTAAVTAWVHENITDFGGDPERIVLAGHSAGAYNVAQVALEQRWLEQARVPAQAIRGVVGLAGPYDFYPYDSDSTRAAFGSVGVGAESQPVNHTSSDAPPMLLVHGEQDSLVKPRNTRALAAALEDSGADVETLFLPAMTHNDPLLALANPWRRDPRIFDAVTSFLGQHTALSVPVQAETP
ncbi:alpha/beta hydrolase fold domain-containing protein [Erythrobacter aquimaris]|uniref:Alpha/beta hydrolase fold domain-containing protein n=1 Tax=Qipengyuania aquimaris TaxID=255984 RepID=A0A6I4TLH4_9SPHN|nr:alpha/beta hydrolase [Qipengyuania aquimaris]MXO96845.1 alpha/beta hydrolase fold domain-containing protein [Qipengyuania aquimaris]